MINTANSLCTPSCHKREDPPFDTIGRTSQGMPESVVEVQDPLSADGLPRAHIGTLPTEILQEILLECCYDDDFRELCPVGIRDLFDSYPTNGPRWLGLVCSRWRVIIYSTPMLWTHVELDLDENFMNTRNALTLLGNILAQSRNLPLTITLIADSHHNMQPSPLVHSLPYLESLMKESHRWKELNVGLSYTDLRILERVRGKLPLLSKLVLMTQDEIDVDAEPISAFQDAPQLRTVIHSPDWGHFSQDWNYYQLPWTQVQEFVNDGASGALENSLKLLRIMPNLIMFHDRAEYMYMGHPEQSSVLRLNHLSSLLLKGKLRSRVSRLDLPNLLNARFLEMKMLDNPLHGIACLLRQSQCSLRELELTGEIHYWDQLLHILKEVPELEKLKVCSWSRHPQDMNYEECDQEYISEESEWIETILQRLTYTAEHGCLLPKLHFIHWEFRVREDEDGLKFNRKSVHDMWRSRVKGAAGAVGQSLKVAVLESVVFVDFLSHLSRSKGGMWKDKRWNDYLYRYICVAKYDEYVEDNQHAIVR